MNSFTEAAAEAAAAAPPFQRGRAPDTSAADRSWTRYRAKGKYLPTMGKYLPTIASHLGPSLHHLSCALWQSSCKSCETKTQRRTVSGRVVYTSSCASCGRELPAPPSTANRMPAPWECGTVKS